MSDVKAEQELRQFTAKDVPNLPEVVEKGFNVRQQGAARMIALKSTPAEILYATGYNKKYLKKMMEDDEFKELVRCYEAENSKMTEMYCIYQKLTILGMTAVEELQERLSEGENLKATSTAQLLRIAEEMLDRTVAPSKRPVEHISSGQSNNTPLQVNINFSDPKPEVATIDVTANPNGSV